MTTDGPRKVTMPPGSAMALEREYNRRLREYRERTGKRVWKLRYVTVKQKQREQAVSP